MRMAYYTFHCKALLTMYHAAMVEEQIDDALDQVRRLSELVSRRRMFRGYSGRARMACGVLALIAAFILSLTIIPAGNPTHLFGWGVVLILALLINYGAVAWWYISHPDVRNNPVLLKPAMDALPALAAGGILTVALVSSGQYDLLFGVWMLMYGLAQTTYRTALPRGVYWTGMVYMVCGALLAIQPIAFTKPWPMGIVFFFGELAGGLCLLQPEDQLI